MQTHTSPNYGNCYLYYQPFRQPQRGIVPNKGEHAEFIEGQESMTKEGIGSFEQRTRLCPYQDSAEQANNQSQR